jgi:hypothetical protein
VTVIAYRPRPRAARRPDARQASFLTDARFILKPDFERLAMIVSHSVV